MFLLLKGCVMIKGCVIFSSEPNLVTDTFHVQAILLQFVAMTTLVSFR